MLTAVLMFGAVFAMAVGIVALVVLVILKRSREIRLLTVHGVSHHARVVRKLYRQHTKRIGFYGIIYEFTDSTGKRHSKNVHLNMTDDHLYEEGGLVEISFMPTHPSVNALKRLVEQARR